MNLLIFENQVQEVASAFENVNILDFDNTLVFEWVKKSQDFKDYKEINKYDIVFVDIDLSPTSHKDGFGVIDELINRHNYHSIVIMTGHTFEDDITSKGLDHLKFLKKPIMLDDLKEVIESFK